jgi:hypothetical protein
LAKSPSIEENVMGLENDTKASFKDFAARVDSGDIDLLVLVGGKIAFNEKGDPVGIHASNIADGDAEQMTNLLSEFLTGFIKENRNEGLHIVAVMLQQLLKQQFNRDFTIADIAPHLITMLAKMKPTTH